MIFQDLASRFKAGVPCGLEDFVMSKIMLLLSLVLLGAGCTSTGRVSATGESSSMAVLSGQPGDVVVLIFGSPDCPISNALAPEYERLYEHTADRGGRFCLVHARPDVTADVAKQHAKAYKLSMPIILDPDHDLVDALDATVTPEAVVLVFDENGKWKKRYQGQINDLYASLGNRRNHATQFWLRDAIDVSFDGGEVELAYRKPIGCYIERRR